MKSHRMKKAAVTILFLVAVLGGVVAQEEDAAHGKRGRFWDRVRLGANISFLSGLDDLRSNSGNTVVFRNINIESQAIRFEPRVMNGQVSLEPVVGNLNLNIDNDFIRDPRKDGGSFQDNGLEETPWIDLNATYDVKTWKAGTLFVELDAGYYQGQVGNLEVAVDIAEQAILDPEKQDLRADDPFANFQFIFPTVGDLTQTPISLSGLWQFRPRSPLRPYVGLGYGYMAADLSDSPSLQKLNSQLAGISYSWSRRGQFIASGILPAETITAKAKSAGMFVAQGGMEYNINRKWSVLFSTKFISTPARIEIRSLGKFQRFGEGLDRSDSINDVDGIGTEEMLIRRLRELSVEDAVRLIDDIIDIQSGDPMLNERQFFKASPVALGQAVQIEIPNQLMPGQTTSISRQSKLFVHGGDIRLDSFSVGVGFRYRY
ncbi:MAG: hypothetical protein ACE5ID_03940 [Acidobacteriota bacterium]